MPRGVFRVHHCTPLQHMPAYKLSKVHVGGTLSKRIDDLKFRAKWHRSARGELPTGIRGTKWSPLPGPPPCVISAGGGVPGANGPPSGPEKLRSTLTQLLSLKFRRGRAAKTMPRLQASAPGEFRAGRVEGLASSSASVRGDAVLTPGARRGKTESSAVDTSNGGVG